MTDAPANQDAAPADKPAEKPAPWGADFDPDRAWKLIQNLRTDLDTIKSERDELKTERQAREDAKKSDQDKLTERLTATEQQFKDAQRALFVERALRKHAIPDELVDFLTGDTEEAITAKAEKLATLGKPAPDANPDAPAPDADAAGRPTPALTPGHGGDAPVPFDPAAIAKKAREAGSF